MDVLLLIIAIILMFTGIAGCFLPVIPGPPIVLLGILSIHFSRYAQYTMNQLLVFILLSILVQLLDYFVPIWGTKKFGGSRAGIRGSTIGLLVSLFVLPLLGIVIGPFGLFGIIAGPFVGAYMGETIVGKDSKQALHAAIGSFIGFLAGTFMKLIVSLILSYYLLKPVFYYFF